MKEFLVTHKGKIATALIVLGVVGAWLSGALPLDEAMRQIGAVLSSSQEVAK